ncbi:transporter substrate-binding protein [Thermocaproicibacter melissae]|uniref:transporter substrate-binding protein n=1 Tax=Thermocaproicibacter melissae TaxID=2966552 RepID=UPI0024B1C060|nr:transporter substrate-binding protein [Thermocaproicibacter melissae]WBY63650.1 transporter substrate-binding protein [Thermocaproicibacter melissae]
MKKKLCALLACAVMLPCLFTGCSRGTEQSGAKPIKIGLLYSLSGVTSVSEKQLYNGTKLAIDEINASGGINGRKIETVFADYASDPAKAADKARRLILDDKVTAIVGTCSSSARQAVKPVVEQYKSLLVYPQSYEGQEESKNIVYVGCIPNQQAEIFVNWLLKNVGKKFFLIGCDFVYPQVENKLAKEYLAKGGGTVVGEEYVPYGSTDFSSVLNKIKTSNPDIVYSELTGDSNVAFYKQYNAYGLKATIASLTTNETVLKAIGKEASKGSYICVDYFKNVENDLNKKFVQKYAETYKDGTEPSYAVMGGYNAGLFLGEALKKAADPDNTQQVIEAFKGLELDSPSGQISIDPTNNHAALYCRIGQVDENGEIKVIYQSEQPIAPKP